MKPSDNEIEMLAAGFSIQHKNGLIRFAHALLEKYASARAIAFDDWLAKHCDSDDLTAYERELAWDAWNAALSAHQASKAVRDAEDAARWRWATASDGNADKLCSIVLCHGGYQDKINERADFYRAALSAQPGAQRTGGSDAVPNEPLRVFSAGMWTYDGTGQAFSHTELDEAAFVTYRDALPAQKEKIDG
ncbi:hypothetical protein [Achromobacter mucicolens]|uniref:hypothetical protein n=1 Tax=Achromobacter mucicolens TaxID=1389922 RepID=UPI003975678E